MIRILCMALCVLLGWAAKAQNLTQTVRGLVVDKETQAPLSFANVVILDSDPILGASADMQGYFKIEEVPVGRIDLQITYVGYDPIYIAGIEVTTGKEVVLTVQMEESITLQEVVVTDELDKGGTVNEMSLVSTRTFSVEESKRYAGTMNDVSRMAMNFAGVRASNDAVNDIVIRGNSPNGLLWRLEGIDIPNPNHFGDGGATGGPISMLNNNVLSNSDFLTGAFPAEYGNALSGVFDLRLRKGNNERHEFLGQIGFNGFEFGAEGPINKEKYSSYLINYRYSTLEVLQKMGMDFGTGTAVPYYQDITFKLNFPGKKFGSFSMFGIGGISDISFLDSENEPGEAPDDFYGNTYEEDIINANKIGVVGVTHNLLLGEKAYWRLTVAGSAITNQTEIDSLSTVDREKLPWWRANFHRNKLGLAWYVNAKLNPRNSIRVGVFADYMIFNLKDSLYNGSTGEFETLTNYDGNTYLIQPYAQWQHKLSEIVTFNFGLHTSYLGYNGSATVEPRAGAKWQFTERQTLSLGFGMHSQMPPIEVLQSQVIQPDGSYVTPNEAVGFTKSNHFVLGYDLAITENIRMKLEGYYQSISDAVVEVPLSPYSMLNRGSFSFVTGDSLINGGTGTNYGIEFTLEKFITNGGYFLFTMSLFESNYKGSDGVERNTAFNGNYVFNLLGGQEFQFKSKKENPKRIHKLVIDGKVILAGGQRYTPIDPVTSAVIGESYFIGEQAYSQQFEPYFRIDARVGYKMIGKKITQEWAFDVQNVIDYKNPLYKTWDSSSGQVVTVNQLGLFPVMLYRINF